MLFYTGILGLLIFEIVNVYFIMPLPGSQQFNSIDIAYFLYSWRWVFRLILALIAIVGLVRAQWKYKWTLSFPILILGIVAYMTNFIMAAEAMFKQPNKVTLVDAKNNKVDTNRLVIGVRIDGTAKAYPIQYLGYHHFVYDTISGKNILVTYCTVCRTGRVFEPLVNGKLEQFRLVGMDHYNAMIEDATTKSWWRQSNGEAITGKLKGIKLAEIYSTQTSLAKWLELYPQSMIMQADSSNIKNYDTSYSYESGKSKSKLTGTDSTSWQNKSWVIGVKLNNLSKAFDWNELKNKRIIQSKIGAVNMFLVLAKDNKSFFAYENINNESVFIIEDTLFINKKRYKLNGEGIDSVYSLIPLNAYQEFWHSWKSFQNTTNQ